MASDAFIKFEGIEGESTDDKYPKWIEVYSYSFGASQSLSATASSSGSLSSARVDIQDFSFTHDLDLASAKLFEYCCTGKSIPKVTVSINRASGDTKQQYQEYILTDVIVSSISIGGSTGNVPTESISLAFGKIETKYTKLDATGKMAGNSSAGWDRKANKKV
ncbi:Hcp family type VI secretion system effector [Azotobacter chroococcum]|uniref:Hcp family type VI secretion system effector n=1 Tax=Azotobacter chroococcum TaxID=353 RepID=UPI0010ADC8A3|nr:type VI secretion system tube protein Hcp [Azotobacter chroococcum]TKD47277.1 type VI secretion system tube protein Hcp [Azotobacter chroococcum]